MIKKKRRISKRSNSNLDLQHYKSTSRTMTREDHLSHIEQVTADLAKNQKPFWNWMKHIKGCHQDIPEQPRKSRGIEQLLLINLHSSIYTKDDVHSTTIPYSIQESETEITNTVFRKPTNCCLRWTLDSLKDRIIYPEYY